MKKYSGIIARSRNREFSSIRASTSEVFNATNGPDSSGTFSADTIPIVGAQNYTRLGTVAVLGITRFGPGTNPQINLAFSPTGGVAYALLSVSLARYTTAGGLNPVPIDLLEVDHPIEFTNLGSGDSNQVTGAGNVQGGVVADVGGHLSRESSLRDPILLAQFSLQDPALIRGRPLGWPGALVVPDDQLFLVRAACEPISKDAYERALALGRTVVARAS